MKGLTPPMFSQGRKLRPVLVCKAPATLKCKFSNSKEDRSAALTLLSAIITFMLRTSPGQAWTKPSDMHEI